MAWRDALNCTSLSSYEKGQLIAMIGLRKLYAEADVDACVTGLDAEALCGLFKTLLPSLPPSPPLPAPSPSPEPAPSATPDSPSSTSGAACAGDDSLSSKVFEEWLESNPCQKFTNIVDLQKFLQKVPIPAEVYKFITSHLHCVPKGGGHLHTIESVGGTCFLRDDYFTRLIDLGERGVKAVMFSGRKRFGKSVALPHELVRARKKLLGAVDQALFFYPGYGRIPELYFSTIIRLLAHMKIPAMFDEFINVPAIDIGKAYNLLLESKQEIEPLSAVLFGSDEVSIWNKGFWFARPESGAVMERLPAPPLSVIHEMLLFKEPDLHGCELGLRFLRKVALYGHDLNGHMGDGELSESVETLKKTGTQAFSSFYGGYLTALERLVKNFNCSSGIDSYNLANLETAEYIIQDPNKCYCYGFTNPQTVAYQASLQDYSLEKVEEKVLRQLLRLQKHLLGELLQQLGVGALPEEVLSHMWHDTLSKKSKFDFLFIHGNEAFMVSVKRLQAEQNWQSSFVGVLDSICKEWKLLDKMLCEELAAATHLRLVAVSAGDGHIGGTEPTFYASTNVPNFKRKEVSCERVFLHQLLERLAPIDSLNH